MRFHVLQLALLLAQASGLGADGGDGMGDGVGDDVGDGVGDGMGDGMGDFPTPAPPTPAPARSRAPLYISRRLVAASASGSG